MVVRVVREGRKERGERKNKYLNEVKNRLLSLMCAYKSWIATLKKLGFFWISLAKHLRRLM